MIAQIIDCPQVLEAKLWSPEISCQPRRNGRQQMIDISIIVNLSLYQNQSPFGR